MTENKFLVELFVPSLSQVYDIYLPVNRRIGNIITLLNKALFELSNGEYQGNNMTALYDRETGKLLDNNMLVRDTTLKNGSGIIII